jgi:hypothetical protein
MFIGVLPVVNWAKMKGTAPVLLASKTNRDQSIAGAIRFESSLAAHLLAEA